MPISQWWNSYVVCMHFPLHISLSFAYSSESSFFVFIISCIGHLTSLQYSRLWYSVCPLIAIVFRIPVAYIKFAEHTLQKSGNGSTFHSQVLFFADACRPECGIYDNILLSGPIPVRMGADILCPVFDKFQAFFLVPFTKFHWILEEGCIYNSLWEKICPAREGDVYFKDWLRSI